MKIKTVTELRNDLLHMYEGLGAGRVKIPIAKEKSNAAGKIIKTAAVQLEYAAARRETPHIPFLV